MSSGDEPGVISTTASVDSEPAGRPYRGELPHERALGRRRKLLDAGYELFGSNGFADTRIQDVCAHAGVTARHFYEAFADKDDLLVCVIDEVLADVTAAVSHAIGEVEQEPYAMSAAGLASFFGTMLSDPRRARLVCLEVTSLPIERALVNVQVFVRLLDGYAAGLLAMGKIHVDDVHLIAVMLAGAIRQILIDQLMSDEPADIEALARSTTQYFARIGDFAPPDAPSLS